MLLFFLIFHSLSLDFLKQTAVVNHRRLQIDRAHLKADPWSRFWKVGAVSSGSGKAFGRFKKVLNQVSRPCSDRF